MPLNLQTLANTSESGLTQQRGAGLIEQPSGGDFKPSEVGSDFNLENLARTFLQSQANQPRDNFIVGRGRGGTPIFDFTKPSKGESIMKGLEALAQNYLQGKQQQKKQNFVKKIKEIMSSSATPEDKMNGLTQLYGVDPELYKEFDIEGINKTFTETLKVRGQVWKPKTREEQLEFAREKAELKPKTLTGQYREDLQRAKSGQISWDEVKKSYPDKYEQIEKVRKTTLPKMLRSKEFRMGTGTPFSHIKSMVDPNQAEIDEATMKLIEAIQKDSERMQQLLGRRQEAESLGINVRAILEYFGLDETGRPKKSLPSLRK